MNKYQWVLDLFIDSKDERDYFSNNEKETIKYLNKIIAYSPKPIKSKIGAFDILAKEHINSDADKYAKFYRHMLYELNNNDGIFVLDVGTFNGTHQSEYTVAVGHSFDDIEYAIDIEKANKEDDPNYDYYLVLTKWINRDGVFKDEITYFIIDNTICYIGTNHHDYGFLYADDPYIFGDCSLISPFDTGDIIKTKGYGLTNTEYILIMYNKDHHRDYNDCCALQGIALNGKNVYNNGAVGHGFVGYSNGVMKVPYLFSAERIHEDEFDKVDSRLLKIRELIMGHTVDEIERMICVFDLFADKYGSKIPGELIDIGIENNLDIDKVSEVINSTNPS